MVIVKAFLQGEFGVSSVTIDDLSLPFVVDGDFVWCGLECDVFFVHVLEVGFVV